MLTTPSDLSLWHSARAQDTLKKKEKCWSACQEAIKAGKSCVIDNTNVSVEARQPYIAAARSAGVPVRCFLFTADMDLAQHLNHMREVRSTPPVPGRHTPVVALHRSAERWVGYGAQRLGEKDHVPSMVYFKMRKDWQEPRLEEGISEVVKINFQPTFLDDRHQKLFKQFY